MKINFTMWYMGRSGGNRVIFEVSNGLIDHNHEVIFTSLGRPGDHRWFPLKAEVKYVNPPLLLRGFRKFVIRRFYSSWNYDVELALSRATPDCDVNVATWYPTAFAVWFSGKGEPYYLMQDFPELVAEGCERDPEYCLKRFEATLMLPFYFMADSSYTKDLILEQQPRAKVKVTGVGVDNKIFYPRCRTICVRDKSVAMVILHGRSYKGDEIALQALNLVNRRVRIHAIILGSKEVLSKVTPNFTYTHFRIEGPKPASDNELARLYSSADVFVFASYTEGFGLPPLEAMACGTPVVTTDCKGNRDYTIAGYNALVVPPGDPQTTAEAVLKILSDADLADQLRIRGLETAKKWTWERVIANAEEAFKEGIKG